ncbi:hypothetical protein ACVR05_04385 [Streptococcus caprae]|uniref:Uncharacterized protein n=1 Tax=Streptococcus caprae TaxID=1640501 RepID=A0ABV8CXC0_9STRE
MTQSTDNQPISYAIPGLAKSKNIHAKSKKPGKLGWAKDMTPQGLTIAGDFVIVSAYSKSKSYYSVLWLIRWQVCKNHCLA